MASYSFGGRYHPYGESTSGYMHYNSPPRRQAPPYRDEYDYNNNNTNGNGRDAYYRQDDYSARSAKQRRREDPGDYNGNGDLYPPTDYDRRPHRGGGDRRRENSDERGYRRRHEDDDYHYHRRRHADDRYEDRQRDDKRRRYDRDEQPSSKYDDSEGHYIFQLGESITERYKILSFMGEGTFAKVVECWDRKEKKYVAVKIIRAVRKYTESAEIEIDLLNDLRKHDPKGEHHCIELLDSFMFRGHMCLVFNKYGSSLYDFIRKNNYKGFRYQHVHDFARQLIDAVNFLHGLTLIHTDLKPENILMVDSSYEEERHPVTKYVTRIPKNTDIKVIDFGSATYEHQHHSSIICTRHYRAPEVILGLGWSYPSDMWSVGCILYELYTGDALFQTHENREHLALMEKFLGPIPVSMASRADRHSLKYFRPNFALNWPEIATDENSVKFVEKLLPLDEIINDDRHVLFKDLLRKLLEYEPHKRITAAEALKHPFITMPPAEQEEKYGRGGGSGGSQRSSTSEKH